MCIRDRLYPVLLLTLMQDSRKPDTGVLTALTVLVVRCIIGVAGGEDLMFVACQEYPGACLLYTSHLPTKCWIL